MKVIRQPLAHDSMHMHCQFKGLSCGFPIQRAGLLRTLDLGFAGYAQAFLNIRCRTLGQAKQHPYTVGLGKWDLISDQQRLKEFSGGLIRMESDGVI